MRNRAGPGMTRGAFVSLVFIFAVVACQPALEHQPKFKVFQEAKFFSDGASAREPVPDTVSRTPASPAATETKPSLATLRRGRERYEIYCSVCHGLTGKGDGLAVERGFQKPESLVGAELRQKSVAAYVEVMAHGDGAMESFSDRLEARDQVAIAYYLRALQLSQNFEFDKLSDDEKRRLGAVP